MTQGKQASASFLKKRSKKLLLNWAEGVFTSAVKVNKVFFASFLFTKKKCFLAYLLALPWPALAEPPAAVTAAVNAALRPSLPIGAAVTLGNVNGALVMPACPAALLVLVTGVRPYENAAVSCPAPGWTLYVPVTVMVTEAVVVLARPVAAGQVFTRADLAIRPEPEAAYTGQPVFYDPAAVAGSLAMLSLPAGAIVTGNDLQAPILVKAGQIVSVDVRSGGVDVSINAVAAQVGRLGDTIMLTNPSSGRRFTALLTAAGPVVQLQP
jgi:flagella basal body P-ring formation protein FlgA